MKYKVKTKIDDTDLADMQILHGFTGFLIGLGVASAQEASQTVDEIIADDFCGDCERHVDDCSCRQDEEGRYMREYDDGADFED